MPDKLNEITEDLFHRNAYDVMNDSSDELYDALVEKAQKAIETYGWPAVFESWKKYMIEHCHTVDEAISFANWFFIYGGPTHVIPEPYKFLAYLYDIFDLRPVRYDAQIMDDVSYGLLMAAGIKKNLWSDDSYTTETDPEMIKAVEELRKSRL